MSEWKAEDVNSHALRTQYSKEEAENLSLSRSMIPIFLFSVVCDLSRLFNQWEMNMNTRNREMLRYSFILVS